MNAQVASFDVSVTKGCVPLTVNFTNTSTNAASFYWTFGDGANASSTDVSHTYYLNQTVYDVVLYAYDSLGNVDTASARITTTANAPYFDVKKFACPGEVLNFYILGNYDADNSVTWNFGDGFSSTKLTAQHSYTDTGKYSASMIVTNLSCGTITDSILISVSDTVKPRVHLHPYNTNMTICPGDNFPYYYDETLSILWDFGDGNYGTDPYPNHIYTAAGIYDIKATVTNECGITNSLSLLLFVDETMAPSANFLLSSSSVCPNETFKLTGNSTSELNYIWEFDDNTKQTGRIVNHSFTASGLHSFKMIFSNNCGKSDTLTGNINVVLSKVSNGWMYINIKKVCPNTIIYFTASPGFYSYEWDFGDSLKDVNAIAQHTYLNAGSYFIRLRLINFCFDTLYLTDTVVIDTSLMPLSSFSVDQNSYCPGSIIYFNVNGSDPIKKYTWDFGDTAFDSIMSPAHSYAAAGSYSVSLIVENYCGKKDTSSKIIIIDSTSLANADFTTAAGFSTCSGTAVQFKNISSDTVNVKWYFGDGDTSIIADPVHTFTIPGNYWVKLTVKNACGSYSSIAKLVKVSSRYSPIASINIADSSVFCISSPIYLEAKTTSVNAAFIWDFDDGTGSTIYNPVKTFNAAGYYTVRLEASNFCGIKSDSIVIHIIDKLMTPALTCSLVSNAIIFSWDSVPYAGSYEININSGGWQALPSDPRSFQKAANAGDSISAVIRALGLSGCSSDVSVSSSCIYTGIKEGSNGNSFQISPNPFTDNLAIHFDKNPDEYELSIYDELSQKVFKINIENKAELKINLSSLPPGLYLVTILNLKQLTSFSKKIIKY